jgi:hypothetical protein
MPGTPKVLPWFKAYAALFALLYFVCSAASLLFFFNPSWFEMERSEALIMGALLLVSCLPPCVAFVLSLLLQPKPWVWIYDPVLICIGLTSPCCMPASMPLLINWLKPEAKAYFGRS